jgi:hypothetical protein
LRRYAVYEAALWVKAVRCRPALHARTCMWWVELQRAMKLHEARGALTAAERQNGRDPNKALPVPHHLLCAVLCRRRSMIGL